MCSNDWLVILDLEETSDTFKADPSNVFSIFFAFIKFFFTVSGSMLRQIAKTFMF